MQPTKRGTEHPAPTGREVGEAGRDELSESLRNLGADSRQRPGVGTPYLAQRGKSGRGKRRDEGNKRQGSV